MLIHTIPLLIKLPISFNPDLPFASSNIRSIQNISQLRRRSNSRKRGESRTKAHAKQPVIRSYYRALKTALPESDAEYDYSEVFSSILQIIGKRGDLHLLHLSDIFRTFSLTLLYFALRRTQIPFERLHSRL